MDNETNLIEPLKKNTSQLADWQFKEIVVEKINEVIVKLNQFSAFAEIGKTDGKIDINLDRVLAEEEEQERIAAEKAEAEELEAKAKAEEERAAKELENQNAPGSQQ
jgi:pyruvate-formate lyase-activating enzyme